MAGLPRAAQALRGAEQDPTVQSPPAGCPHGPTTSPLYPPGTKPAGASGPCELGQNSATVTCGGDRGSHDSGQLWLGSPPLQERPQS